MHKLKGTILKILKKKKKISPVSPKLCKHLSRDTMFTWNQGRVAQIERSVTYDTGANCVNFYRNSQNKHNLRSRVTQLGKMKSGGDGVGVPWLPALNYFKSLDPTLKICLRIFNKHCWSPNVSYLPSYPIFYLDLTGTTCFFLFGHSSFPCKLRR